MSFAIIKNAAIEQILHGDVDPSGDVVLIPEDLEKLPFDRLLWTGAAIVDAMTLRAFYIDSAGKKYALAADDRQLVECEFADKLVLDDGVWRRADEGDELAALKVDRISQLTNDCAAAIVSGYKSSALGAAHTYPSKITDQINMMGSVTDSLLPGLAEDWSTPFWCQDGEGEWAFRPHSAEQIQQAGGDEKQHILDCQAHLAMLSAEVTAAATVEAVLAIVWEVA